MDPKEELRNKPNVYGSNTPQPEEHSEKDVEEILDEHREDVPTGGMGRPETPKEEAPQGEWESEERVPESPFAHETPS